MKRRYDYTLKKEKSIAWPLTGHLSASSREAELSGAAWILFSLQSYCKTNQKKKKSLWIAISHQTDRCINSTNALVFKIKLRHNVSIHQARDRFQPHEQRAGIPWPEHGQLWSGWPGSKDNTEQSKVTVGWGTEEGLSKWSSIWALKAVPYPSLHLDAVRITTWPCENSEWIEPTQGESFSNSIFPHVVQISTSTHTHGLNASLFKNLQYVLRRLFLAGVLLSERTKEHFLCFSVSPKTKGKRGVRKSTFFSRTVLSLDILL